MFQKQLAGYTGRLPTMRRIFPGLTKEQNWCSLASAGMNQFYRLDLLKNLDNTAMPLSCCRRKTDQTVMLPQDFVSAPQAEIEKSNQSRL